MTLRAIKQAIFRFDSLFHWQRATERGLLAHTQTHLPSPFGEGRGEGPAAHINASSLSLRKRVSERAWDALSSSKVRRVKTHLGLVGSHLPLFSQREKGGPNWKRFAQLNVTLIIAVALKYFYSTASVNQLRWILAPVTVAVEFISGRQFAFEPYAGYIDSHRMFVIAASCAGVNFLITSFLMLALGKLWRDRSRNIKWRFLPIAAAVAYVATLVANTVRITTAMQLRSVTAGSSLTAGQLHRLEGIFVYFGFLLLLYVLSERADEKTLDQPATFDVANKAWLAILRRSVFPLVIYYATTLGIPLLNGAFRQPDFWEHSIFVLATPLIFVIPFAGFVFLRVWWDHLTLSNEVRGRTVGDTVSAGALARFEREARTFLLRKLLLGIKRAGDGASSRLIQSPAKVGTLTTSNRPDTRSCDRNLMSV